VKAHHLPAPSKDVLDEVVDVRRHLHRHPEVAFQEHETSAFLRGRLAQLGLSLVDCPTETGAVAVLDSGEPGRTVLMRADIDALPILEDSGVDFASGSEGRMHACGHDAHTAILLGAARTLVERAEDLTGQYVFVFQPAEEIVSGAKEMLARGLFERITPDVAVGLHVWSPMRSGVVVARPGVHWAGTDAFEISFRGPGGHGGTMGRRGNVISAQAFLVERLHTVVDGLQHDGTNCHCTIGDIRGDGAFNIVPRTTVLRGSVRTFTPALRAEAMDRLKGLLTETETEFEVQSDMKITYSSTPVINDARTTQVVLETGRELFGDDAMLLERPQTVGDDMAEFLLRVPGCYFMVGAAPAEMETPPSHHSPSFRIDEGALPVGVKMMAASAARLARPEETPLTR
jgi:amidohydrolase